ncbi:MAG: hypothetical protein JRN20_07735 [Nitrososphaerota archaeon]|nr:hypothetical protein [Nitrososphaerota archaeon]
MVALHAQGRRLQSGRADSQLFSGFSERIVPNKAVATPAERKANPVSVCSPVSVNSREASMTINNPRRTR